MEIDNKPQQMMLKINNNSAAIKILEHQNVTLANNLLIDHH